MLKGRRALLTGSTSGIGLAAARAFAQKGADLVINGFGSQAEITKIRDELKSHNVRVEYVAADLAHPDQVVKMVKSATELLGGVDILVNNAGIQHVSPTQTFPLEMYHKIIAINMTAVFVGAQAVLPQMYERKWGRIINTASVHGLVGSVNKAPYVASKHGVVGMTKVIGLESAGTGVTCNAVCPGFVQTPLIDDQIRLSAEKNKVSFEEGVRALLAEKQPSKQFVTTDQIGEIIAFLASDAAAQITGVALPVDGGWTAQ